MIHTRQLASGLVIRQLRILPKPVSAGSAVQHASGIPALIESGGETQRRRLSRANPDVDEQIWPLRKHRGDANWDTNWSLYWLPLKFSNKRDTAPDARFMDFFARLLRLFQEQPALREYTFIDTTILHPHLMKAFILNAMDYIPMGAIGFRPEEGPCKIPDYEDATSIDPHKTYKMMQEKQSVSMHDIFANAPAMLYYLPVGHEQARRELSGRGGYGYVLSKLNQSGFFDRTKQMLARNSKDEALLRLPMVAPTLSAASFSRSTRADLEVWFSLMELYVQESPGDKGVLIASNRCLDDEIAELVIAAQLNRSAWRKRFGVARPELHAEKG